MVINYLLINSCGSSAVATVPAFAPFGKALFLNHDAKVQHSAMPMADY